MMHKPKKPAGAQAAAAAAIQPAVASTDDDLENLRQLKLGLQATREKLLLVSPDLLNDADHKAWSEQMFQVSMAINGLRNQILDKLSDEFKTSLPDFAKATDKLTDDLFELQQATDVIKAISGVLGVITKVAQLVA